MSAVLDAAPPPAAGPTPPPATKPGYTAGGVITAVLLFVVLTMLLPFFAVGSTPRNGDVVTIGLAWLIVVYSSVCLAALALNGGGSIVRLGYMIFLYVFMGIAVLAQLWSLSFPLRLIGDGSYNAGLIRRALFVVIIASVAFEVGHLLSRLRQRRRAAATPAADAPTKARRWYIDERRAAFLGVLGLAFAAVLIYRTGITPFFTSRQATGNAVFGNAEDAVIYSGTDKASGALISRLAQGPCLIALFAFLYLKRHQLPVSQTVAAGAARITLITALIVVNLVINNPIANSRFWFGTVVITLASVYVPLKKSVAIRWVTVLTLALLLFGFTSLQAFRYNGGAKSYSSGFQSDLVSSGTYSEFSMEMIGARWASVNGNTYGEQLLGSIFVFVPRSVWAGKPVDTGNVVLPIANPAAPFWTEADVEGGPLMVVVYFALLGYGVAALDRRFKNSEPGQLAHAVVPICGGFMIFVLRGSLLSVFGAGYMLLFSVLLLASRRSAVQPVDPAAAEEPEAAVVVPRRQRQRASERPSSVSNSALPGA